MDDFGRNLTNLTNDPGWDGLPDWSPDGLRIAFASDRNGNREIFVMDHDGENQTRLTVDLREPNFPRVQGDQNPAWSPDGSRIGFDSDRKGHREVYVMDRDGQNPTRITHEQQAVHHPAWSPDGTRIAYVSAN